MVENHESSESKGRAVPSAAIRSVVGPDVSRLPTHGFEAVPQSELRKREIDHSQTP